MLYFDSRKIQSLLLFEFKNSRTKLRNEAIVTAGSSLPSETNERKLDIETMPVVRLDLNPFLSSL